MEFIFQNPSDEEERHMYECVLQEIALEGLDGITLQGLWERLIDREGPPISRGESRKVKSSIWEAIKRDPRLTLYLLPTPRPWLLIWNRMLKTDTRGNVEEPPDAPEDIYPYKPIDIVFDDEKQKKIQNMDKDRKTKLSSREVRNIDLKFVGKNKMKSVIEGIRFDCQRGRKTTRVNPGDKPPGGKSKNRKRKSRKSSKSKSRKSKSRGGRSKSSKSTERSSKSVEKGTKEKAEKSTRHRSKSNSATGSKSGKNVTKENIEKSTRNRSKSNTAGGSKSSAGSTKAGPHNSQGKQPKETTSGRDSKIQVPNNSVASTRQESKKKSAVNLSKNVKAYLAEANASKIKKRGSKKAEVDNKKGNVDVKDDRKNKKAAGDGGNDDLEHEEKSNEKLTLIRGSCAQYYDRKDISKAIRKRKVTSIQATKIFGTRLVVVANQFLRESMLFARNNQVRIASQQYCMIERIGRARHYGEQARGKISLTCLNIDAKAQFYHRKALLADRLIAKQGFIMRFPENRTGTLISVFHLPHFFRRLDSAEAINIRKIFFFIHSSPNKTVEYYKVQNSFGKHLMRVINDNYKEFIDLDEESYAVVHPEEYEKEKKAARKESLLKRKVRVMRLKNVEFGIRKVIEKQLSTTQEDDDTVLNIEDGDDDEEDEFDWEFCHNKSTELAHELEATALIKHVIARGNKGLLLQDIAQYMEVNHLDSRSASRYLLRWKLVNTITEEQDKIKLARYVYSRCDGPKQAVVSDDEENEALINVEAAVSALFDSANKNLPKSSIIDITDKDLKDLPKGKRSAKKKNDQPEKPPLKKKDTPKASKAVDKKKTPVKNPKKSITESSKDGPKSVAQKTIDQSVQQPVPPAPSKRKKFLNPKFGLSEASVLGSRSSTPFKSDEPDITENNIVFDSTAIRRENLLPKPRPKKLPSKPPAKPNETKKETLPKKNLKRLKIQNDGENIPKSPRKRKPPSKGKAKDDLLLDGKADKSRPPPKTRSEQYYDDVDRRALGLLKKQRVEWSANEDRLLLHLFVSSILFIPRYNLQRVFIFNSSQIRDILHKVAEESKSKTSIAVRRRLHFLMKNRVFYSKYRNLLNFSLRDEYLYANFVERNLPRPSMNIYHRIPTDAIMSVYEYLLTKFHDKVDLEFDETDYSISLEEVLNIRELRRMEGIWIDVWGTLFKEHGEVREYVFPKEDEASQTIKRKLFETIDEDDNVFEEDDKKPTKLPKLSTTSEYSIGKNKPPLVLSESQRSGGDSGNTDGNSESENREPESRTTPVLEYMDEELQYAYQVSKCLIENIQLSESSGDDSDNDTSLAFKQFPSISRENRQEGPSQRKERETPRTERRFICVRRKGAWNTKQDIASCERNAEDEEDVILWTGRTALLSMVFSGEGFETVQEFMASVADSNLEKVLGSLRNLGILSVTKVTNRFCLSSQMRRRLISYLVPTTFRIANSLLMSILERPVTSLQNFNHLGAVHILSELSLLLKIKICLPDCIITVHKEWKKDYESLLSVNSNEARDKENYALRLLRLRLNADTDKSKFVEKDFFDINLPQILVSQRKGLKVEKVVYGESISTPMNGKLYLENSLIKIVEYDARLDRFGAPNAERNTRQYDWLYNVIDATEEIGLSMHYLTENFKPQDVKAGLDYLIDCNYIYMVGIHHRKFVSGPCMKNWTTAVVSKRDGQMARRVVMRPWMNAKGDMNWKLLDRAYTGILGYLQRYPILLVNELCRCLSPIFSRVETMILVSTFIHLEIVGVYRMSPPRGITLFSKPKVPNEDDLEFPLKDYEVDPFLEMENLFVELMPFYSLKYAKLQQGFSPVQRTENPMSLLEVDQEEVLMKDEGILSTDATILGLNPEVLPTLVQVLSDVSEGETTSSR